MANISLKAQGRKSMADSNEIKQTPIPQEEEQFEGGFTPIVKFSQDFDRLSKYGKLEYPKYRTLSEEQTRSYIKLNELPEYKRLQMRNDVKAASEQSLWQNTKNAFINTMADAFSKEKTELALGNILVSGDYEPANVVRDLGFKETEKSKSLQGIQDLISEPKEEKKEGRTKLQALGLAMTKDALDGLEYRAAVMPKVDEDSWGSLIGGGVASALTFYASGIGGRALGRGIAKPLSKRAKKPHTKDVQDRYSDIIAAKTADVATSAYMYNQVLGEGALSSIEKYIEDTGDVNLDNYTGDLNKIGFDIVSARIQDVIEKKLGFGRFINNPRLVTKYGEWLNGFAQEFSQGEVSDIFEWIKGNKTFEEVIKNIPNNLKAGVIGSPLQGIPGTAYYTYYHNKTVNDLTDSVMSQSTPEKPLDQKKVRSFVEDKVRQLEEGAMIDMAKELSDFSGATQYRGKIYDTIRDNVEKTINYQREVMKDTLEGSKYDDMSEEELAQHIEAVAEDNADRAVIDALERKIPLSESPLLKGETLDGTYYIEGSDYAKETAKQAQKNRQMIHNAVYAAEQAEKSAKEAISELKELNLSMQAEKLDIKLPTQPNDKVAFEHKNQQFEVVRGFDSNTVNLAVNGDNVSAIEVKDDGMVRDTNTLPEMQNQGLATEVVLMAENLFGDLTITVAEGNKKAEEFWFNKMGYTEEIAPRTYKKAKQDVSFQETEQNDNRELVVTHGITLDKLEKALELGGLPVPSIAISKVSEPLKDFGAIKLVGTKDIIDPENRSNLVYDRDIWSKRFPRPEYKNAKLSDVRKFRDKFEKYFIKTDDDSVLYGSITDPLVNSRYPAQAIDAFQSSKGAKLYYIENFLGEKIDIPKYDRAEKMLDNLTLFVKPDEKFIEEISKIDSNIDNSIELKKQIEKPIKDLIERFDFEKKYGQIYAERFKKEAEDYYFGEKFRTSDMFNLISQSKNYLRTLAEKDGFVRYAVDNYALSSILGKYKLYENEDYMKWSEKQITDLMGEPRVKVGNKMMPWTLENITSAMIKGKTVGSETNTAEIGKIFASGATKFSSIKSIREKGQALQTKEQSEAQTDELGKNINYLADDIVSYAGLQGFSYIDDVLMALEEGVSKTNITEDSFERLLNKNLGISKSFPKVLLKRGVNLIKDVKKVVRYYFEAKPQRAVMLEEFVGAVIPTDSTYDKISHKLTERGLIVKRTDDLRTGIQDIEAQKPVLFQDRQRGKGGAYDARTRSITLGGGANVTTFFHEFAHYWIDKNFKWARSGKASTAWMQQWRMVEKWLGIDPEDKYLDKIASEKFARAYERFLAEEELPLVLKKAMIDYRDFVLDHYDYELDDAKGLQDKLGRPIRLDDSIKAWFRKSIYQEYMSPAEMEVVNERLALDDQERKDIIPQLEEASEMRAEIANSPGLNKIDISGGQIQREAGISNAQILGKRTIGGGEEKVSKGKIAQELGKTYESTNWDIQEQMVSEYLETVSLDEAIDDLDNETYPEKIDANFLRQALVERLLESGRELEAVALIEQTADDFTQAAQTLQAARKINTPFTNAIRMLTVGKAEKLAQARYGRNENAVAELDKAMNALIDKYQSDFMNAQTEEERELVYATMQDEAIKTIGTLDKSRKNDLDFQDTEDKEERKQAKAIRKQQIRRASINGYRSRAKRALKQALGLEPTRQQVRDIKKLSVEVAKQIRDFRKAVNENKTSAIDPTKVLVAQNKLNEYMNKQLPPRVLSTVADATNSFMMANMLWNPATNVFNLESTWVQMIPHMLATRINYGGGTIAWSEKLKLIKQALALQAKTGYNIFSLRDFFDKKTIWAEKYYEPTTLAGKAQRFPLTALGLMDTMNKGVVFLHHADSMATKQAKEEGAKNGWNKEQVAKRAKELFYQALNTDPRTITIDGLKIRKAAVQEGEEATFTQVTKTAELVNKFRKMLNLGGKTGLGNIIMPFTTTVANIAEDTVLNYGLGSVRGLVKAPQAIATQFDKTATAEMKKEAWKAVQPETKNVIKNAIGILMVLGIALSDTDDDEYVLGYDRQTDVDKDIRTNRNAPYGYAVRIGDKWVDLDLFGIGSPWAKMYLIAKRYGFSTDGWVKGIASNIDLIPGVGEISSMYDKYTTTEERSGSAEAWAEMGAEKLEELSVRLIPMSALFGQLASIADDKKRESWNNWYDKMLAKIPYARETLPARTSTQTGKELPQTDVVWNLATGQRIKDYIESGSADKARYEFALEDKTLSYREGNSKLKELGKGTVRYKNAVNKVRKLFSKKLSEESKKASYKRLSIEEKKEVANKLHKEALESVKAEYGLAKKKKKR